MSIYDLIFILVVLCTATTLIVSAVNLLRGRRRVALNLLRTLGIGLGIYLVVVVVVAVSAPQKVLQMGKDRCFDEMCFAAIRVRVVSAIGPSTHRLNTRGNFYVVDIRISNHGRQRAQREAGVRALLIDSTGRNYEVSPQAQHAYEAANGPVPSLTSRLQPGESVSSTQVFDIPHAASGLALHIGHAGPALFIIGDDESPLHKPTLIHLNPKRLVSSGKEAVVAQDKKPLQP